jgi:hypothetical protein
MAVDGDSKLVAMITPDVLMDKKTCAKYLIVHDDLVEENCVFFSIDIETGGEDCGMVQLSAVQINFEANSTVHEFDMYINPGHSAKWDLMCMMMSGLNPSDHWIKNAAPIDIVWPEFVAFIEGRLDGGAKKGMFIAWNGKSCDLKWLFHVVDDSPDGVLHFPCWCPYFMDPMNVLKKYKSCQLSEGKHGLQYIGNSLRVVWSYANNMDWLPGAHLSLVNAQAQSDIVTDKCFTSFIDKPQSIEGMGTINAAK